MSKKRDIHTELVEFYETWRTSDIENFLRECICLFELYDVEDENDWVEKAVGKENEMNVRMIRTVYLLSRISDFFSGKMCKTNGTHPKLWQRLEKHAKEGPHE